MSQPQIHQLAYRLIGQRARTRHHADAALLVNVSGHDADFYFIRRNHAGAIGTDKNGLLSAHPVARRDHVAHRHALRDANDQIKIRIDGLIDGAGREGRRNVDHGNGRAGLLFCIADGAVDRYALEILPGLARIHSGDEASFAVGVIAAQARVKRAGLSRDALGHHPGVSVNQDAHDGRPCLPFTAATIFWAASAMLSAEIMSRPEASSAFLPSSSFVPFMRTTNGTLSFTSLAAAITPSAIVSQRMIPPKMFTKIPLTAGFFSISLNASVTFCAVAPPPTSRKFAGSAPNSLIVSMVAMASPAPLTKQPMLPPSEMYDRSYFDASTSAGSSSSKSRIATMSGWRNSAFESKFNFASSAITSPFPVMISGLISASEASRSTNARYSPCMNVRACAMDASGTPIFLATSSAWRSVKPASGSTATLCILSGWCAATSSISMPPSELAIKVTRCVERSTTMPTYSSLRMSAPSSTSNRLTTLPSGPV